MFGGMILDDNMSNLTSASTEASITSSSRNEIGALYPQESFAPPYQPPPPPPKKKRNLPGNPDPEAEVMVLSPGTLMATNRFVCEICNKGFQREQNLQLHRRGHNLPWKLKQRNTNKEMMKKKVYVCPEPTCVHHHPSRALGDLTGIKKHFSRKHGDKKWKCEKCSKRYAVRSDWKAHSKICGTREYRCDCGTLFSRRDSFITHRAFCDALAKESASVSARASLVNPLLCSSSSSSSSTQPCSSTIISHFNLQVQRPQLHNPSDPQPFPLKREQDHQYQSFNLRPPDLPPWLAYQSVQLESGPDPQPQLFSSNIEYHENPNPSPSSIPSPALPSFHPTSSPHMSATALLQKAAEMSETMSRNFLPYSMLRTHQTHMGATISGTGLSPTAGSGVGLDLSSCGEGLGSGFAQNLTWFGSKAMVSSGCMEQLGATATVGGGAPPLLRHHHHHHHHHHHSAMMMGSLPSGSGFGGSLFFEEALDGMLNQNMESSKFQEKVTKPAMEVEAHLSIGTSGAGGGGGNSLTKDFLGLGAFSHGGFSKMAGLDQMNSSSSYDRQNQN